ncbi:MAG: SCO family protein [Myxococcales bacterium]|nr:SCO family protein [Myxococcales bacterium]
MSVLVLLACATSPSTPGLALAELGAVPEFTLVDQTQTAVTRQTLLGETWIADFMFTSCPDICPTLSARMSSVAARYEEVETLKFLSFSVDPVTDTPARLADYGARFGARHPAWRLLTGDTAEMRRVVVDGFKLLMERSPATDTQPETVLHGSRFLLVDKRGQIRAYPDPKTPGEIEAYVDLLLAAGG